MSQADKTKATDRYISFEGIDCDGNAKVVMACIERLIEMPGCSNAFWDYFIKNRAAGSDSKPDDLFLIH